MIKHADGIILAWDMFLCGLLWTQWQTASFVKDETRLDQLRFSQFLLKKSAALS